MKKFRLLAAVLAIFVGFAACSDDDTETEFPEIQLGATEVTLASDGSVQTLGYQVINAVEGLSIEASTTADWLTINTAKARTIEFSASANESGDERTASVTISYTGAQSVEVNVKQLAYESPLRIVLENVGATDVTFTVETTDPELTWIPMITYKEYYDSMESDEELFQEDLEYFNYLAEIYELSLEEYLSDMLAQGTEEHIYFDGLKTETAYVLYAYGLSADGRRTTEIVAVEVTTTPPYEGDITFSFEVSENNYVLEYTITPSHTGVPYFCGLVDEATLAMWKETYQTEDLREAIQLGEIQAGINKYLDYGFIEGPADYFAMYSEDGIMDWGWEQVAASTKYIIYAARWNEECELLGELATYEHTTQAVEPSDNQITLTVSEVTQSSARMTTTTTNDDPYVVIPVKSSELAGMNDEEIFAYILSAYDYMLSDYTFESDYTKVYKRMRPETEYTFLAFGFLADTLTTQIWKQTFITLPSGDPADCTFQFYVEPDTDYAWVEVTPSDKGLFYHWLVYPSSYTADDAKNYIKLLIEEYYEGNWAAFASWELSQGDEATDAWDLIPDTEYKVGAVLMDYDTGEFLSDVFFSEPFKTEAVVYADLTIDLTYGPYYDLEALIAAGYTDYEENLDYGDALLPVSITVEGDCAEYYYDIYVNDLSDTATYPDNMFYDGLWYGSWYPSTIFVVKYDRPMTLVAVGYDSSYNASVLLREVVTFTKEGASPVEDFVASSNPVARKSTSAVAAVKAARVERTQSGDAVLMNSVEIAAKKVAAKAEIEKARFEKEKKAVELRKERMAKKNATRMIARNK